MLILPWMLLIATMWPRRLLIMEGRSAEERGQGLQKRTFFLGTAPNAERRRPCLLDVIRTREVTGDSPWVGRTVSLGAVGLLCPADVQQPGERRTQRARQTEAQSLTASPSLAEPLPGVALDVGLSPPRGVRTPPRRKQAMLTHDAVTEDALV